MKKDFYQILGVSKNAGDEEIKRAYKRLAKQYHPDKHSGEKNFEDQFKEISEAYQTLSDHKKRDEYDQIRRFGESNFRQPGTGFDAGFDFNELLNRFRFSRGGARSGVAGFPGFFYETDPVEFDTEEETNQADIHSELNVTLKQAATGDTVEFVYMNGTMRTIRVRIPQGIEDGGKISLKGQGRTFRGRTGDLILTIRIQSDSVFYRKGPDIYTDCKINFAQMLLGSVIRVRTVYDETVDIRIPANTLPGTILKASKLGIRSRNGTGDFYVKVIPEMPGPLNKKQKELFEAFARSCQMNW